VEAARSALIAGIAICGLAVVVLSFLPWLTFETRIQNGFVPEVNTSFSGLDISRARDVESIAQAETPRDDGWCSCNVAIGDGYFTATLGLVLIASAGIARIGGRPALGGAAAALAGLAIVAIAGFDGIADWSAIVHMDNIPVTTDGSVRLALYALIAVGAIAAIDGTAAWTMSRAPEPDEEAYDYDEDEEPMEGTEAWA